MDELLINVLQRALIFATPLYLATQGSILNEKAGILNLGMEGLIAFGAWAAFAATQASGSAWIGILAALAAGLALASVHAFITVTFRANQVVSGLALTMIGTGAAGMWGKPFIGQGALERLNSLNLGPLSNIPFFGRVFFRQDPFFWISIASGLSLWFFFRHTRIGLRLRAVGDGDCGYSVPGGTAQVRAEGQRIHLSGDGLDDRILFPAVSAARKRRAHGADLRRRRAVFGGRVLLLEKGNEIHPFCVAPVCGPRRAVPLPRHRIFSVLMQSILSILYSSRSVVFRMLWKMTVAFILLPCYHFTMLKR